MTPVIHSFGHVVGTKIFGFRFLRQMCKVANMEQENAGTVIVKSKRPIGCFGWGAIVIFGLWALGSILPDASDSATPAPATSTTAPAPAASTTAPAPAAKYRTSGCNTISSEIFSSSQKLAGIGSGTYAIEDATPILLESGEKWGTWAEINKTDGNVKAAEWLATMSTEVLKTRVALLDVDADSLSEHAGLLARAFAQQSSFCP